VVRTDSVWPALGADVDVELGLDDELHAAKVQAPSVTPPIWISRRRLMSGPPNLSVIRRSAIVFPSLSEE
jgi:hypothetical protein